MGGGVGGVMWQRGFRREFVAGGGGGWGVGGSNGGGRFWREYGIGFRGGGGGRV